MSKKDLNITLYKSELIYEVQNKTYLTGRSRHNGENHEQVANMQAGDDDEHLNQILRSLGSAFSELKTRLADFIDLDAEQTTANNKLLATFTAADNEDNELEIEDNELEIELVMPANYNTATADAISSACHNFVVNTAVADWYTLTAPAEAAPYASLAAGNIQQIRDAANKRTAPTRSAIA